MGPPLFSDGDPMTAKELAKACCASMGPPLFSDGDCASLVADWIAEGSAHFKKPHHAADAGPASDEGAASAAPIWAEDHASLAWLQSAEGKAHLDKRIAEHAKEAMLKKLRELCGSNPDAFNAAAKILLQ